DILRQVVEELEQGQSAQETGQKVQLAIALDNLAQVIAELGNTVEASQLLERSINLFPKSDLERRARHAQIIARFFQALGNREQSAQAFGQAHDLALEFHRGMIDKKHYEDGFYRSQNGWGDPHFVDT
ncbi:MAG: hypothetical protein L0220_16755, partial [Acidobacteria bacterium]|nr:hypothetical protein [Acidobacteriota bacterium]